MARPTGGVEHVVAARELLRSAKTDEELRRAQAVLLPLDLGKLAPDTYHPQGDAERREVWKKRPEAIAEVLAMFPTSRPLRVMYQDEARFGRISDTRYCWAKKPTRPEVEAMLIYQYTYAYAAVSPQNGRICGTESRHAPATAPEMAARH